MPPSIEVQVEFITDAIRDAEKSRVRSIEATAEAEREYSELCDQLAANSLFWKAEVSLNPAIDGPQGRLTFCRTTGSLVQIFLVRNGV